MHQREKNRWLKHLDFMVLDMASACAAFYLVCRIRMRIMHWVYEPIYRSTLLMLLLLSAFVVFLVPLHKNVLKRGPLHELIESLRYVTILAVGIMLYLYLNKSGSLFSRGIFLTFWAGGTVFVWLIRTLYKLLINKVFLEKAVLPDMILLVSREHAAEDFRNLSRHGRNRFRISGIFTDEKTDAGKAGQPFRPRQGEEDEIPADMWLGDFSSFEEYSMTHPVDEVFIDLGDREREQQLAEDLLTQGTTVHIALDKSFSGLPNQEIGIYGGRSVMTSSVQSVSPSRMLVKRIMDIAGALVGLAVTGIAWLIFAPIITRQSPGPVFYSQWRIGQNGRRFRIYKFRSMYPDADSRKDELRRQSVMQGPMFNVDDDPRIIPIGHFMRKHSIDELPQFWNVLKGEMSLVGTRPPTVDEWEHYSPRHRARLSVRPGITGMWQVSGRSDIIDFEEVLELDMKYIREWSLKLDCKLLLKTIRVVFAGEGAK